VPVRLAGAVETDLLLFFYTDRESFHAICGSADFCRLLLERSRRKEQAEFGAGVYASAQGPDHFGTKSAILINLHSNAQDRPTQLLHIEPHCGAADYCVPLFVPRPCAKDAMSEATSEMAAGPGSTVQGERARAGRDIWVLALDLVDDAIRRLSDADAGIRAGAVRSVRETAARGDARAVEALLSCLSRDRDAGVRAATAGALGEVAARGDARTCEALEACLGAQASDAQSREAAALALGKVTPKGNRQAVEALARCLDGDPDRGVRASAAFVLGKVAAPGDVRAVEALTYRFEDEDEDARVSSVAGHALKRLGVDVEVDELAEADGCVVA